MEQLRELVKQRLAKIPLIIRKKHISSTQKIKLQQQEKLRCQKQNSILQSISINKNISYALKEMYFRESFLIMKMIDNRFDMPIYLCNQTFHDDFRELFRQFFCKYDDNFMLNTKFHHILRRKNSYLISDLIKYLIEFSRQYYQQKTIQNLKKTPEKIHQNYYKDQYQNIKLRNNSTNKKIKSQYMETIVDISLSEDNSAKQPYIRLYRQPKKDPKCYENQLKKQQKQQINKLYEILDIYNVPSLSGIEKNRDSLDAIKFRFNEIYKDMKYRNNLCKNAYTNYCNKYQQYKGIKQFDKHGQVIQDYRYCKVTHPFLIGIMIEKNGFSSITVRINESTRKQNWNKYNYKSPTKIGARILKPTLTQQINYATINNQLQQKSNFLPPKRQFQSSVKVLNISEDCFPPIVLNSQKCLKFSSQPTFHHKQNFSEKISQKMDKKQYVRQQQSRYYSIESISNLQKQKKQKKKLRDLRKLFKLQQPAKDKNNEKSAQTASYRLLDWMKKIKIMKDIQNKKVMGIIE